MKIWFPMILYLFVMSITPGPSNLSCLFLGATKGRKTTFIFMFSSIFLLFIKSLICGFLNIALSDFLPGIVVYVKWIGAAYMLFLAYKMIISGWHEDIEVKTSEGTFLSAVILQLLNAKSWIASLSVFAVYVIPVRSDFKTVFVVSFVFFIIALVCSQLWAAFGSALKNIISKHKKIFGVIMGLSLIWCAVSAVI